MKAFLSTILLILAGTDVSARDAVRNWYFDYSTTERVEVYFYSVPDTDRTWSMTMRHKGRYENDGDTFVSESWGPDPSDPSRTLRMYMSWKLEDGHLIGRGRDSEGKAGEGEMRLRITSPMTVEYEHFVEGRVVASGTSRLLDDRVVAEEEYYGSDGQLTFRAKAEMKKG